MKARRSQVLISSQDCQLFEHLIDNRTVSRKISYCLESCVFSVFFFFPNEETHIRNISGSSLAMFNFKGCIYGKESSTPLSCLFEIYEMKWKGLGTVDRRRIFTCMQKHHPNLQSLHTAGKTPEEENEYVILLIGSGEKWERTKRNLLNSETCSNYVGGVSSWCLSLESWNVVRGTLGLNYFLQGVLSLKLNLRA